MYIIRPFFKIDLSPLLALGSGLSLGAEVGRSRTTVVEEAAEERRDKGVENDLGTTVFMLVPSHGNAMLKMYIPKLRNSHPEDKDKLEGVVECCINTLAVINPQCGCS